jgi:hypothetical protein
MHRTLLFILFGAAAAAATIGADDCNATAISELVEWIDGRDDGIIHQSLHITNGRGLQVKSDAAKPIEKGEVIVQIPWECTINSGKKYSPHKTEMSCGVIYKLAEELSRGDKSRQAPYVRYLLNNLPNGRMPGEWSYEGKQFLSAVLGHGALPPFEHLWKTDYTQNWVEGCAGDEADEMEHAAYFLTQSRHKDNLMVPIYDMIIRTNDVEKVNTIVYKPEVIGDVFRVVASKTIQPGEPVYTSYNIRCNRCNIDHLKTDDSNYDCDLNNLFHTSDIFSQYGIVDNYYPQSWSFDSGDSMDAGEFFSSDRSLQHVSSEFSFCLRQDSNTGELNVYWGRAGNSVGNDADIAWANNQLNRLQSLLARKDVLEKKQEIPLMEWESIWKYHSMVSTALDEMIKASLLVSSGGEDQDEL